MVTSPVQAYRSAKSKYETTHPIFLWIVAAIFLLFAVISWIMVFDVKKVRNYIKSDDGCGMSDDEYENSDMKKHLHFINVVGLIIGSISTALCLIVVSMVLFGKHKAHKKVGDFIQKIKKSESSGNSSTWGMTPRERQQRMLMS